MNLTPSALLCADLDIDRSTLNRWVREHRLTYTYKAPGRTGAYFFDAAEVAAARELAKQNPRPSRTKAQKVPT